MKIGIYGGTFNPPHIGHISDARISVTKLGLDKLLVIPAGEPPHKSLDTCTPNAESRLEMCELAFSEVPNTEVSDIEVFREGTSYTSDTIRELRKTYPNDELYLIVGTDMLESLYHWHEADYILREAVPVVLRRSEHDDESIGIAVGKLSSMFGVKTIELRDTIIDISSSEIREKLPHRMGREFISDSVYTYIIKNRLYNASTDFDWLRDKAYRWLKLKRIPHVVGCEGEAVRLARRWGENVDLAREAAILHDVTKKFELDEQLLFCKKYDIMTDEIEKHDYKLLHSKTGAAVAKYEFGVCDEVYSAIEWHTTGKSEMTLLEKIIYMADYIEPTRDFEGLSELRNTAYTDIDKAMLLGLRMSIGDMKNRGIVPHRRSLEALKWFEGRLD